MNISMHNHSFTVWCKLIRTFVHPGDAFEIRCWEDENVDFAQKWSHILAKEGLENVFRGSVTNAMLKTLCEKPRGKEEITDIFTLNFTCGDLLLYSEHYGTELHLLNVQEKDAAVLEELGVSDYTVY